MQQLLGEPRLFEPELQLHAGGKESRALQQALDIGIRALRRLDAVNTETAGHFWEVAREFERHLPQELQFRLVGRIHPRIHGQRP